MGALLPPDIKKAVTFLFDENDPPGPLGTGFWVGLPKKDDPDKTFCYIVTARHVVEGRACLRVRMNLVPESGSSELVGIDAASGPHEILYHPNPAVDVAAIPYAPAASADVDFRTIPRELFATKDFCLRENVGEGDEVFFVGLMPQFYGRLRNYPVVRHGRIALWTEEPFETDRGPASFIYVEANSYPGNSGSPVFLRFGQTRDSWVLRVGADRIMLLGVMHGYLPQAGRVEPVALAEPGRILAFLENINIAMVVPVDYLSQLLESPEAKARRGEL